jgi:hypothetical protein
MVRVTLLLVFAVILKLIIMVEYRTTLVTPAIVAIEVGFVFRLWGDVKIVSTAEIAAHRVVLGSGS